MIRTQGFLKSEEKAATWLPDVLLAGTRVGEVCWWKCAGRIWKLYVRISMALEYSHLLFARASTESG